jgi:hypothetical protein
MLAKEGKAKKGLRAVNNEAVNEGNQSLTVSEEKDLVRWLKVKNRIGSAANRADLGERIVEVLTLRLAFNQSSGRNRVVRLSQNAKNLLRTRRHAGSSPRFTPSANMVTRFLEKHKLEVSAKKQRPLDVLRAMWCTKQNSRKNFADFTKQAKELGIMKADGTLDGSRIITSDECPNPIGQPGHKGHGGYAIAGLGEACLKVMPQNRERVTLDVYGDANGRFYHPHLIVNCKQLGEHLIPDGFYKEPRKDCLLSKQEHAFQVRFPSQSCVASL